MVGYSGTPLPKKLGIKEGHRVLTLGAPKTFSKTLGPLPDGVKVSSKVGGAPFDVIVFFTTERAELLARFAKLEPSLQRNGGLWVAWPKKASKVPTDVTEDVIRALALSVGFVDNKVCAIDETWSGLRCVIRVENR